MATKSEIIDCIEALAVHCRPPLMTTEQRESWMRDWCDDLAQYPAETIASACRKWRHSGSNKFPTPGQLMPLVREIAPADDGPKVEVWRPLTDEEYRALSVREKIRHQLILAHQARCKAGPMYRNERGASVGRPMGERLSTEQMPETWHRWSRVAEGHEAEAKRLREILSQERQPLYAQQ